MGAAKLSATPVAEAATEAPRQPPASGPSEKYSPREYLRGQGRTMALFVALLGIATVVTAVFSLVGHFAGEDDEPARAVVGVVGAVLLVGAGGWISTRRTVGRQVFWSGIAVCAIALGAMVWSEPFLTTAFGFVFPTVWIAARSDRDGILASFLISAAAAVGLLIRIPTAWVPASFVLLGGSLTSAVIGITISRLYDEQERRGALIAQLQASRAEVARLSAERERAAVLRDVHDTVTQNLTAIVMQSRLPEPDVRLMGELASESLAETRDLLLRASPRQLDEGLPTALERLGERLGRDTGIVVTVDAEPVALPLAQEVVLLRVAQEAVANVRKHSQARSAVIQLRALPEDVGLEVRDDGVGFDAADEGEWSGLRGIVDRAEEAGGAAAVFAGAGGTTVRVTLPREGA